MFIKDPQMDYGLIPLSAVPRHWFTLTNNPLFFFYLVQQKLQNVLKGTSGGSEMHYFNTYEYIQFRRSCTWNPLKDICYGRDPLVI